MWYTDKTGTNNCMSVGAEVDSTESPASAPATRFGEICHVPNSLLWCVSPVTQCKVNTDTQTICSLTTNSPS